MSRCRTATAEGKSKVVATKQQENETKPMLNSNSDKDAAGTF